MLLIFPMSLLHFVEVLTCTSRTYYYLQTTTSMNVKIHTHSLSPGGDIQALCQTASPQNDTSPPLT